MPETDELQFEHATYEKAPVGVACGMCGKPVVGEYWQWLARVVCRNCKATVGRLGSEASSPATFAKAVLLGGLAALGCGVGYALVVSAIHTQFALLTIGIAYVVASVIRKVTRNVSGKQYQVLAVALTYVASAMGYAPYVLRGVEASPSLFLVLIAAPFLEARAAPIGLLIIGFGLWEAWRRTTPTSMVITGPYRVPVPASPPPAAP